MQHAQAGPAPRPGTAAAPNGEPPQQHTAQARVVHPVPEVAARSRIDTLRDLFTSKFTGINPHSADFTIVANELVNGADPHNPFTEKEVQAMAEQLEEANVIMVSHGTIYTLN